MQNIINQFLNVIINYLQNLGPIFGILIIILESIFPVLPLGVFIAFNMMAFGTIIGFIMSWLATCTGCFISYLLFRFLGKKLDRFITQKKQLKKMTDIMKKMDLSGLVFLIVLPFTPAFLINIACGLSKMNIKKFVCGVLIGKIATIYFWGFISKSLMESITDINTLITIGFILIISYIVSKLVKTKFNIE